MGVRAITESASRCDFQSGTSHALRYFLFSYHPSKLVYVGDVPDFPPARVKRNALLLRIGLNRGGGSSTASFSASSRDSIMKRKVSACQEHVCFPGQLC